MKMTNCPSCGQEIPKGCKFCPVCGQEIPKGCPECGAPLTGSKFCPECGHDLRSLINEVTLDQEETTAVEEESFLEVDSKDNNTLYDEVVSKENTGEFSEPHNSAKTAEVFPAAGSSPFDVKTKTKVKTQKTKKPFYKKWWFWALVALVIISALANSGGDDPSDSSEKEEVVSSSNNDNDNSANKDNIS